MSLLYDAARVESLTVLSRFRTEFYACPTARKDVLFELADTMLCSDGPVKTLVGFALAPEPSRDMAWPYTWASITEGTT
ncbi:hypothetical protein ACH4U7_12510 [Streptomyces sp. NPDC020845]|uniref:hypothetical protein n=1 Tax=Streptomyces sp. NPDC020845 TaxID=3365096 RepID=UPI0037A6A5A0